MSTTAATKTPIIKDLTELEDPKVKTVLLEVQQLSRTVFADRQAVDRTTAKRDRTWLLLLDRLTHLGRDIAFEDSGVKLTFTPEKTVLVTTPDLEKIAKIAPELVSLKASLLEQLSEVDEKLAALGQEHFVETPTTLKLKLNVKQMETKTQ